MKKILLGLLLIVGIINVLATTIYAHPGRTADDGCHYCRTNCDKWGEVWNQRHCHGNKS